MSAGVSVTPDQIQEGPGFKAVRLKMPVAYYDLGRQTYWIQDASGDWITVSETNLRLLLRGRGFSRAVEAGETLSNLDQCISTILLERNIKYAGALAGYA